MRIYSISIIYTYYIMEPDPSNNEIPRNEYVDQITMELLMSKPKYNKYLEDKDPKKYEKKVTFKNNVRKYRIILQDIINEEFDNVLSETNSRSDEIKEAFEIFLKSGIKYIKTKELQTENPFNRSSAYEDEEVIFDNCDDIEQKIKDNMIKDLRVYEESSEDECTDKKSSSLWGEGALKYDMRMLARRKR